MTVEHSDIFISGGGIAGLIAALGFARYGFSVTLADPSPPQTGDNRDLRSTAFLHPAQALLSDIGAWDELAPHASPLEVLRVINSSGTPPEGLSERAFVASDLGKPAFGWNLPNAAIREVLLRLVGECDSIDLRLGAGFLSILARDREALVGLSDGARLRVRLAVAADGRQSPLREAAGIGISTTRYGQKALAFAVTHDRPHEAVSTEIYNSGGAFVLVPLPDRHVKPASAAVWMNDGADAQRLMALDEVAFSAAATERSCSALGQLNLTGQRQIWPVVTQRASRMTARRVALIAEAAHVFPPIGAQGLNTSLSDIRSLLELVRNSDDPGSDERLGRYATERANDVRARARVIDLYNRICRSGDPGARDLRDLGLRLIHDIAPLRKRVMRKGLGV